MNLEPKKRFVVQFRNGFGDISWLTKWDGFRFQIGDDSKLAYQFCWLASARTISEVVAHKFDPPMKIKIFEIKLYPRGERRLVPVE